MFFVGCLGCDPAGRVARLARTSAAKLALEGHRLMQEADRFSRVANELEGSRGALVRLVLSVERRERAVTS